jgi:hypothetical protein
VGGAPVTLARVAAVAGAVGAGGWLVENLLIKRYDAVDGIPLLPVYAAGGAVIALASPHLRGRTMVERFVFYAILLSALEAVAGELDSAMGRQSWDYGGGARIDVPHALAWGACGLLIDAFLTTSPQGVDK